MVRLALNMGSHVVKPVSGMTVTPGVYVGTEGMGGGLTQGKEQRSWGPESNCMISHGEGVSEEGSGSCGF